MSFNIGYKKRNDSWKEITKTMSFICMTITIEPCKDTYSIQLYQYYVNCGHSNEVKMWSSQLWLRFKQSQIKPEKCFRGFNGIRTRGLCVSAVVLHQLSYEDPYVGRRVHRTRERSHLHFIRLSPEGEVNSGVYIPRREASRLGIYPPLFTDLPLH